MRLLWLAALVLLPACAVPRAYGEGVDLDVLFSGGYRAVEDEDFDGHPVYALDVVTSDSRRGGWGYEIGASYGTEDDDGPRGHTAEFDEYSLGLRREWKPGGSAQPYVGFGGTLAVVEHRLHDPREEFEDRGGAGYVHGGVLWDLGRYAIDRGTSVLVGFDVRGEIGDDYDAAQLALVLGFGR